MPQRIGSRYRDDMDSARVNAALTAQRGKGKAAFMSISMGKQKIM